MISARSELIAGYVHEYCGGPILNAESRSPVVTLDRARKLCLLRALHRYAIHVARRREGSQCHQ